MVTMEIIRALIDIVLPPSSRAQRVSRYTDQTFMPLFAARTSAAGIIYLFPFRDRRVRDSIHELKYYRNTHVAQRFSRFLADYLLDELTEYDPVGAERTLIVPIPRSPEKLREHGYSQAHLLADTLSRRIHDIPVFDVLTHARETQTQTGKNRAERFANKQDAFRIKNGVRIENSIVVLLDDVTTTGATMTAARAEIEKYHPKAVLCVAVAH